MRYKKHGVLLEAAQPWQIEEHGFDAEGKWDCIVRSAVGAMAYNDYELLDSCYNLLCQKRRWPLDLDHLADEQNPEKMTRDPYIMWMCAEYLMLGSFAIKDIKIPLRLYRPHVWAWRRYLITGKGKRWWEFLERINLLFPHKVFSLALCVWRCVVGESDKIKELLFKQVPSWNLLLRVLCDDPTITEQELLDYVALIRNRWTAEDEDGRKFPKSTGGLLLDKDILLWAYKNVYNEKN